MWSGDLKASLRIAAKKSIHKRSSSVMQTGQSSIIFMINYKETKIFDTKFKLQLGNYKNNKQGEKPYGCY